MECRRGGPWDLWDHLLPWQRHRVVFAASSPSTLWNSFLIYVTQLTPRNVVAICFPKRKWIQSPPNWGKPISFFPGGEKRNGAKIKLRKKKQMGDFLCPLRLPTPTPRPKIDALHSHMQLDPVCGAVRGGGGERLGARFGLQVRKYGFGLQLNPNKNVPCRNW